MNKEKELKVELSTAVKAQVEDDPELAEAIRHLSACFRQASYAVATGQHKTFEDALEAITGSRPEKIEEDEDD